MKKLSLPLLAQAVSAARKTRQITQSRLAALTGMNRSVLSRLESGEYTPSVDQLLALTETLDLAPDTLFQEEAAESRSVDRAYQIAVAGTMWAFPWRCCWPSIIT